MGWQEDLEPGQDALVKDDRAGAKLKRAVKQAKIPKPGTGGDDLYTDHHAGDPQPEIPPVPSASGTHRAARRGSSRVSVGGHLKNSTARIREAWSDAFSEAHARQAEKAARKR